MTNLGKLPVDGLHLVVAVVFPQESRAAVDILEQVVEAHAVLDELHDDEGT